MAAPVSVRLDEQTRELLEAEARARNVGLSTLLRQIAAEAAKEVRRQRIRRRTQEIGEYITRSPEAAEFFRDWGTPRIEGL
jgi:hypothetical protein